MVTKVSNWGNSKAIRIPKEILEEVNLNVGDDVTINVEDGYIKIFKQKKLKKVDLDELFKDYNGESPEEYWTDKPVGNELW